MRLSIPLAIAAALTAAAAPASSSALEPAAEFTRVLYLGTPGSARSESFRAFLEARFSEVFVGDYRTLKSRLREIGDVSAIVLDGAPEHELPFLPIRPYDAGFGAIRTPPLVLIGATGHAVAHAHRLMGADGHVDEGRSIRIEPHPILRPGDESVELQISTAARRFGARLDRLGDEPTLERLATATASDGAALDVVFRQGNLLHFGFDASPDELTDEGRDLLASCVAYAARFREYYGAAEPFESALPVPRSDLARLDVDPAATTFPREVVRRAYESSDVDDRAAARRLIARYLPDGPSPFAHPSRWENWFERYEPSLVYSRWRGERWMVDTLALARGVPSAALRGPARGVAEVELRQLATDSVTDEELQRALDAPLAPAPAESRDAAALLRRFPDRAALLLTQRLVTERGPTARRRLVRRLGAFERDAIHELPTLRAAFDSDDDDALRRDATTALSRLGGAGVPTLEEALLDDDVTVRRRAAQGLFSMGHEATPAASALAGALRDPDAAVRTYAAMAFLRVRDADDTTIAALEEAAMDPDEAVRFWARAAIEWQRPRPASGRVARDATPLDDDVRVAEIAALADEDLGRRADAAFTLARRTDAGDLDDETQGRVDAALDEWVAEQARLVDGENFAMGSASVAVLRNVDFALPGMVADLLRYPRFPVGPVTFQPFLPVLRRGGEDALPAVALCLDHWYLNDTIGLEALSHLGREARFAWPALVAYWSRGVDWPGEEAFLRGDRPWFEDWTDHHALLAAELVPELQEATTHESEFVRLISAALIRTLNPLLLEPRASLLARLHPDEPDLIGVADALVRRPPDDETHGALENLLALAPPIELQVVALRVADRLGRWTPPDPATVAATVGSSDPRVVRAALEHLESLGPAAEPGIPALHAALVALAATTDGDRAELFRIKGIPRVLAAIGPFGLDALADAYPSFLAQGSALRLTDSGRFGPREPCAEIEYALLAGGTPARDALRAVASRPDVTTQIRSEIDWLIALFPPDK